MLGHNNLLVLLPLNRTLGQWINQQVVGEEEGEVKVTADEVDLYPQEQAKGLVVVVLVEEERVVEVEVDGDTNFLKGLITQLNYLYWYDLYLY